MAIIDYQDNSYFPTIYITNSGYNSHIKTITSKLASASSSTYCFSNFFNEYEATGTAATGSNYLYWGDAHLYTSTSSIEWTKWEPVEQTPIQKLQEIIRQRQFPTIIRSRRSMEVPSDIRETRARQTLRRVVGEEQFKNFLKSGFVSLRAKSGRIYQIFPGSKFTNVYEAGKMVEKLCVVLDGNFPPTDSVIVRYLMLLNDEGRFVKTAIQHSAEPLKFRTEPKLPTGNLQDILRQLRAA